MSLELQTRQDENITCDYCHEADQVCVNAVGDDRDICLNCILEIYEYAKKRVLE